jgi:HD-GYP domain-containing protein (c-di-GMP phosphodiesterase class II)
MTEEQTTSTASMAQGAQHLTDLTVTLQQRVDRFVLGRGDQGRGMDEHAVAALAMRLARTLNLDDEEVYMVGRAGRLRDIGKIAVPIAVLEKASGLSDAEWALMRRHPAIGAEVVSRVPALRALAPAIQAHHERWDGKGYPNGLAGGAIPLAARILAVTEAFTAMTTDRPHRPAWDAGRALKEIRNCAGSQFDADVVAALERVLADPIVGERRAA